MSKSLLSVLFLFLINIPLSLAAKYHAPIYSMEPIHTTKIVEGWCGNLLINTKLGHIKDGRCDYEKETIANGYDGCEQKLDGWMLKQNAGPGYNCGATQIHSMVTGSNAIDPYLLISNTEGIYQNTVPSYAEIKLKK
jgi:hypothetical protein